MIFIVTVGVKMLLASGTNPFKKKMVNFIEFAIVKFGLNVKQTNYELASLKVLKRWIYYLVDFPNET